MKFQRTHPVSNPLKPILLYGGITGVIIFFILWRKVGLFNALWMALAVALGVVALTLIMELLIHSMTRIKYEIMQWLNSFIMISLGLLIIKFKIPFLHSNVGPKALMVWKAAGWAQIGAGGLLVVSILLDRWRDRAPSSHL